MLQLAQGAEFEDSPRTGETGEEFEKAFLGGSADSVIAEPALEEIVLLGAEGAADGRDQTNGAVDEFGILALGHGFEAAEDFGGGAARAGCKRRNGRRWGVDGSGGRCFFPRALAAWERGEAAVVTRIV